MRLPGDAAGQRPPVDLAIGTKLPFISCSSNKGTVGGNDDETPQAHAMVYPTDDVKNWMNMFRWIVKLIRDEYEVDETVLVRSAVLETDCGLAIEQVETTLDTIGQGFEIRCPPGTLDEVVKLEELCMLAAWMRGLDKRPDFISAGFEERCRAVNAACA